KPIRPEVVPHQFTRGAQLLLHERQRHLARCSVLERREALRLCLFERLEDSRRQPGMCLDQLAPDTSQMHDGENTGAFKIRLSRLDWVRKQPADIGILPAGETGHAGRYEGVDLATLQ